MLPIQFNAARFDYPLFIVFMISFRINQTHSPASPIGVHVTVDTDGMPPHWSDGVHTTPGIAVASLDVVAILGILETPI